MDGTFFLVFADVADGEADAAVASTLIWDKPHLAIVVLVFVLVKF